MTQVANNYGIVLFELGAAKETVDQMKDVFAKTKELPKLLQSPVVSKDAKHRVIDGIFPEGDFPKEVRNFLKVLCDRHEVDMLDDIFAAYERAYNEKNGILPAELSYVMAPDEAQLAQMKDYLVKKYGRKQVELHMHEDASLIGGFVLRVGDFEQDCSMRGQLKRLEKKLTWR